MQIYRASSTKSHMLPQAGSPEWTRHLGDTPRSAWHCFLAQKKKSLMFKCSHDFRSLWAAEHKELIHHSVKSVTILLLILISDKSRRGALSKLKSWEYVKTNQLRNLTLHNSDQQKMEVISFLPVKYFRDRMEGKYIDGKFGGVWIFSVLWF